MKKWIFKAILYRDATDPLTGEISKQPYTVTLYPNGEVKVRWCGMLVKQATKVHPNMYHPERVIYRELEHHLIEEIKNSIKPDEVK